MLRTTNRTRRTKLRRTFSLAPDVAAFLDAFRAETDAPSMTAALEALVREKKRLRDQEALSEQIAAFYDSLPDEYRREELEWADFARSQLAHLED